MLPTPRLDLRSKAVVAWDNLEAYDLRRVLSGGPKFAKGFWEILCLKNTNANSLRLITGGFAAPRPSRNCSSRAARRHVQARGRAVCTAGGAATSLDGAEHSSKISAMAMGMAAPGHIVRAVAISIAAERSATPRDAQ